MGGLHAGGAGGIQARVGAQITRWAAVYAQPVMLVVDARDRIPSGGPVSGWFYGAGAIGEVTIADVVYLGGGPELLDGRTQPPWTEGYPRGSGATSGPYLSMTGRSGFYLFGEMTPKRRQAFTLGVDVRTIFNEGDTIVLPCLGIGYEAF